MKPTPQIVIAVFSHLDHSNRRTTLRNTCYSELPEGVRLFFVTAEPAGATELVGDLLRCNHPERYEFLPTKTLSLLRFCVEQVCFDYLIKIDDDCFVDVPRILQVLDSGADYLGNEVLGITPTWHFGRCTDPEMNCTPYAGEYLGPYASGPLYILSRRAAEIVANTPDCETRHEFYEDKLVGDTLRRHEIPLTPFPAGTAIMDYHHRKVVDPGHACIHSVSDKQIVEFYGQRRKRRSITRRQTLAGSDHATARSIENEKEMHDLFASHGVPYQQMTEFRDVAFASAFEKVVCINLRRREDRWKSFLDQMESISFAFGPVTRFDAIDGERVPAPDWYDVGEASYAWCCLVSHLRVWESALNDGVESILIFEDDAVFCDDFNERAAEFMESLPEDWDQLYFGGHHVPDTTPRRINEHVFRPEATWTTHAYALRGDFIRTVYRHVIAFNTAGRFPNHAAYHVDHQLASLMRDSAVRVYCPRQWLVGQRGYFSDIAQTFRHQGVEYFNGINPILKGQFCEV